MTVLRLSILFLVVLAMGACRDEEPAPKQFELLWEDDFEGAAGELPSAENWRFDIGGNGWGNAQLEYDTARADNVRLDGDGHLAIVARRENFLGREYTSGRIKTQDLFEQAYGRFEARIQLPVGQGIWPAFWMLGADFDDVGWPDCGEIDIMEYLGQDPRVIYGSLHGPGYSGEHAITRSHSLAQGGFQLGFHTFTVEWSKDQIVWAVDGYVYSTITKADLPSGGRWVYDHPFYLLLNVAVGGYWPGSPDETTVFPQTMLVDWVRVYGELE